MQEDDSSNRSFDIMRRYLKRERDKTFTSWRRLPDADGFTRVNWMFW